MNRQVVSIETLKSYFETGKKPTQAQFSNLIDAFYHKNESIPQDKIDGLAETLSNKAETTAVDAKANADASGLSEENKVAWKEVLGVGEVPDNMAKIDTESEQGNVHTKEQIEELLENSGKNIGNSDLKVPEGTERTLDLTGARLRTSGLEDKVNDLSFSKMLVMNERGVWATAPYIKHQFVASAITINNVTPANITPRPTFTEDVERILANYKTYEFETLDLSSFATEENVKVSPFSLDAMTDFIVEIQDIPLVNKKEYTGISRGINVEFGCFSMSENLDFGASWNIKGGNKVWSYHDIRRITVPPVNTMIIIKTGGVITVGVLTNNVMTYQSFNANAELGDYKIVYPSSTKVNRIKIKRL